MYGSAGDGIAYEISIPPSLRTHPDRMAGHDPLIQVRYKAKRLAFDYRGAVALQALIGYPKSLEVIPRRCYKSIITGIVQFSVFWTKHERWSYEEEYRSVFFNTKDDYVQVFPQMFSGIYLGHRVSDECVRFITEAVARSGRDLSVYRGRLSSTDYAIQFQKI
jgi:hypothetical protein